MKPVLFIIIIIASFIALMSCSKKQTNVVGSVNDESPQKYIEEILGSKSKIIPNEEQTLYLGLSIKDVTTRYVVVDDQGNIAHEISRIDGSVEWNDNHSLKLTHMPRVLEDKGSQPRDLIEIVHIKERM